jgi:hypothetical protein
MAKAWKPKHRLFHLYSLLGVRMYAAQTHLVESFIALRQGQTREIFREFGQAARWWPVLPLLPAFYPYCARMMLRLALGETRYAGLRRVKEQKTECR